MLVSTSFLTFCQTVNAQQPVVTTELRQDISNLKRDVKTLMDEQQQIINQLDELKRLLPVSPASQPAPQPQSTLSIHGEVPFRGGSGALVAIIEYSDFECPYCGKYERETYPQIFDNYIKAGKVKLFYRDLPSPMHPHAMSAARAAHCAGEQTKYWEMHDDLFANQTALGLRDISDRARGLGIDIDKLSECLSSDRYADDIRRSVSEAQNLGIDGTPTFFIGVIGENGNVVKIETTIKGAAPFEVFKTSLDALLALNDQGAVSAH